MQHNQFALLGTRRFLPLFLTQFFGALNDSLFKQMLIVLVTYHMAEGGASQSEILATLAQGLLTLPFFLFSATAGRLADKFDKRRLVLMIKVAEILFMAVAALGFATGHVVLLFVVVFLMGVHSTFFGPIKYGILPAHLQESELLAGNGLVEAGTFLAILIGTIAGGLQTFSADGTLVASTALLLVAGCGLLSASFLPSAPAPAPNLAVHLNIVRDTGEMLSYARRQRDLFLAILGISWFWLVGAIFVSQFAAFAKNVIGADQSVTTLFLVCFTVGIAVGSLLCNRLLSGHISVRFVPLGALGITLFTVDLFYASQGFSASGGTLLGIESFLATPSGWRVVADLALIAMSGGVFVVPLNTLLQTRSEESHRARIIAANNIWNALFIVGGAIGTVALLALHFTLPQIFLTIAVLNFGVALYICRLLPGTVAKPLIAMLLRLAYRVEVKGIENYRKAGKRAVVVANHTSLLDGPLLAAFLPGRPIFPVNTFIARRWWARPLFLVADAVTIDPTSPLATKALIRAVQAERQCVVFPEGRITVTGALMKIYEGPGMIADKAEAPIVPVRIDGAQLSPFSYLRGKLRLRLFPRITITILEPRRIEVDEALHGRPRRQAIGMQLYDIMTDLIFETTDYRRTLFAALLEASAVHGRNRPIIEDVERQPISYGRLLAGSFALGRRLAPLAPRGRPVGVLLPNAIGLAVTFFALQAHGRVPALLNFSTGAAGMLAACKAAELETVLTSRRFIALAKLDDAAKALVDAGVRLVYLEDIRERIGLAERLRAAVAERFAGATYRRLGAVSPDDPAIILFTSGSEGTPKGVVLSHANILANRYQLGAVVDFTPTDIVFNALPLFHSFGLTGGLLLPVLAGVKTFLYPTPLHYRIIPILAYDTNATILFGTDTFLAGYARMANAYDFYSVRYVVAGAERVRAETRRMWSEKFGLRILEGYGATEASPVIAINTPMQYRAGTVGRFLPGISHRLDAVPGIERGGRLAISGPNIMRGYLRVERPGQLDAPESGWYDTGDIVEIDAAGFVTIAGRAKRFAKIAGEMVSLGVVEELAAALWPGDHHAAVTLPDARRGEQVILVTDHTGADRESLLGQARKEGHGELLVPKAILVVPHVPLLGTGKVDYPAVTKLAAEREAAGSPT